MSNLENKEKNLLKRFFDLIKNFFNSNKVKKETKQKENNEKKFVVVTLAISSRLLFLISAIFSIYYD